MLYDSGTMTGGSTTKTINVNVQGRSEMWLVVTDNGDGRMYDHADWADARLVVSPLTATVGDTETLSSLKLSSQQQTTGMTMRAATVPVAGRNQLWMVVDHLNGADDDVRLAA
jgi:hypothetical protein